MADLHMTPIGDEVSIVRVNADGGIEEWTLLPAERGHALMADFDVPHCWGCGDQYDYLGTEDPPWERICNFCGPTLEEDDEQGE